jgi:hypothetical protein
MNTIIAFLPMIIGAIMGVFIAKGAVWFIAKAKSQQSISSNGSINIQAKGDLYIGTQRKGGHRGPSESDMKQLAVDEPEDEAASLKQNLLD